MEDVQGEVLKSKKQLAEMVAQLEQKECANMQLQEKVKEMRTGHQKEIDQEVWNKEKLEHNLVEKEKLLKNATDQIAALHTSLSATRDMYDARVKQMEQLEQERDRLVLRGKLLYKDINSLKEANNEYQSILKALEERPHSPCRRCARESSVTDTGNVPEGRLEDSVQQDADVQSPQNALRPTSRSLKLRNEHSATPAPSDEALSLAKGHQRRGGIGKSQWSNNSQPMIGPVKELRSSSARKKRRKQSSSVVEDTVEEDDDLLISEMALTLD